MNENQVINRKGWLLSACLLVFLIVLFALKMPVFAADTVPSGPGSAGYSDEVEPNDTMAQAQAIQTDRDYQMTLTAGDVDYFQVTCSTSSAVQIDVSSSGALRDLKVQLYRETTKLKEFDQSLTLPFFSGYTYYLAVSAKDQAQTATDYILHIRTLSSRIGFETVSAAAIPEQIYDGTQKKPSVTLVESINQVRLTEGRDYTLTYANHTNVGTASVTVNGTGMFLGASLTLNFSIAVDNKDLSAAAVGTIGNYTYTGNPCTPTPLVSYRGTPLRNGIDYILTYSNNISAGTASVTIVGQGNYRGSQTVHFTISGISIYNANVSAIASQPYTGYALTPAVTLVYAGQTLVQGRDYTLTYVNNTQVGTASVIITGKDNFSGSRTVNFTIGNVNLAGSTVAPIPDQVYNGSQIRPTVAVSYGGRVLVQNQDYTLVYPSNAVAIGTYTITIYGKGSCVGSKTVTYRIVDGRLDIGECAGISYIRPQVYTGSEVRPRVEVYASGVRLSKNVDYTLAYQANRAVGKAKVVVRGIGRYTGTLTARFRIRPKKLTFVSGRWTRPDQITLKWKTLAGVSGYEVYRSTDPDYGFRKIGYSTKNVAVNRNLKSNQTFYYKVRGYKNVGGIYYYGAFDRIRVAKR